MAKQPTSGFEVPTGSGKVPHEIARVKLYTPPKYHTNPFTRLYSIFTDIENVDSRTLNTLVTPLTTELGTLGRIFGIRRQNSIRIRS